VTSPLATTNAAVLASHTHITQFASHFNANYQQLSNTTPCRPDRVQPSSNHDVNHKSLKVSGIVRKASCIICSFAHEKVPCTSEVCTLKAAAEGPLTTLHIQYTDCVTAVRQSISIDQLKIYCMKQLILNAMIHVVQLT